MEWDEPQPPHIKKEEESPYVKEEEEELLPLYVKEEEEALQPPHIKDEDHSIGQEGEQLEELEEFPVIRVIVKGQDEDEAAAVNHCGGSQACNLIAQITSTMADGGEIDMVSDILKHPFSKRTFPEKLDIVRRGRPTPKLVSLSQQGKGFVRHFQSSAYERYNWLTASKGHCKLYCWECLLFASDRTGVWSNKGFANLSCLSKAAVRHQATAVHLKAAVLLRTFGEPRVDLRLNEQVCRETELHNEKVNKNREILKRLIDCVIFLGKQELSFRGHTESAGSANRGNYMELLSFLAENNAELHYHLSTNKVFCGASGKIQNDLVNAIGEVMRDEIRKEVREAPFVAVMVDEATDASNSAAQLALVLRYVTAAGVKERFVTYEDVPSGRRADDVAALIVCFLEKYECLHKAVAQSFDGTTAVSSGLNGVQAKIKEKAPLALFIHCYAHRLNLVLTQGVSKLKECKIFFAHLSELAAFFSRSPKRAQLLDDICQLCLPRTAPTRWQHTSRLVSTVFERRDALKEVFNHILEHHDEYDEDSVRSADGFHARLDNFDFCFLLHAFNGIFEHCDVLFGILKNKPLDVQLCLARVKEFCDTIELERERFSAIYVSTVHILGPPSTQNGPEQGDIQVQYQQLHKNVLDNILCQLQNRFHDHKQLMFLSLLDHQQFQTYRSKFPHTAFSSLTKSHGTLFDLPRLKTELTVMYAMLDFKGKCPTEVLDFLHQKNLSESMPQLYRLACLTVTMPMSTATLQPTCSALKRVKTYARNTLGQSRLAALASMSIEKDFLMDLKRREHLYDRVIEVFLRKERRMDFVYKSASLSSVKKILPLTSSSGQMTQM
ncbi:zinc finger MYM-type protein 1-like [Dunckerocampus dactyliophorus]|uniref:zinc finger MYM-type protein 1-like n=1 Tax=Dunckerocampus dactyliophorus TaxID=161453 RepID=UPI002404CB8E|nr:zinc finger MYM-type protein 1-like [Dunckerocampus dactyliophorus]